MYAMTLTSIELMYQRKGYWPFPVSETHDESTAHGAGMPRAEISERTVEWLFGIKHQKEERNHHLLEGQTRRILHQSEHNFIECHLVRGHA